MESKESKLIRAQMTAQIMVTILGLGLVSYLHYKSIIKELKALEGGLK